MINLGVKIIDVFPMKAQFLSEEPIKIAVEVVNEGKMQEQFRVEWDITFLNKSIEHNHLVGALQAHEQRRIEIEVSPKKEDFKGYGMDVSLFCQDDCTQEMSSAFDVVSNWRKSTRYGFLSDFYTKEAGDRADVESLNKLHINLVQFYDWMYKHDDLVSPVTEYTDLMGRILNRDVVQEKIHLCHQYGMKAMAYGAVYAASKEYYEQHKDSALYDSNGNVIDFIHIFYIMNIAKASPWHDHIINQYNEAIVKLDFDGIHMDTYGSPKTAISKLNQKDSVIRLEEHFPELINHTRQVLEQSKEDIALIFNNVGNWPVDTVALAEQDAVYIEVWDPYERYHHIGQIMAWANHLSHGKPVILAAYLKPFREEKQETIERAHMAALLLTAVITSNGGYHLLLGEENAVLTQGYYVDYSKVDESFMRLIRNYYDFLIRYANVFFNHDLRDVSMTHLKGDNLEYQINNVDYSTYGEPNKVWTIVREKPGMKVISFINLTGNEDDRWNEGKETLNLVQNIEIKIIIEEGIKEVFLASPDQNMGRPQTIDYEVIQGDKGKNVVVTVPELYVWSVLVLELE
jgi:dextranase